MKDEDNRLSQILEILTKYAHKDFSWMAPVSGKGDELDAIATGLNAMAQELLACEEEKRISAETVKKLSEEQTRSILENALDAVISINSDSTIIGWNAQAETTFGFSPQEAINKKLDIIIPAQYREAHFQGMKHLLSGGEGRLLNQRIEITALHKNGREFPVELAFTSIKTNTGLTFSAFVRDITERKKNEQRLRESEERLQMVLQNMPVMLDAFDEEGNIVVWNRECEKVTGYEASEIIGNSRVMELLYPDAEYRQMMMTQWKLRTNDYYDWEWEITHKDGSIRVVSWSNITQQFPVAGWATWGVGVDVTERKRADEMMRQINQELERRVKERTFQLEASNKELEAFSYSVSHDLRAPLRAINGYAEVLNEDYVSFLDDEGRRVINIIKKNAAKMGMLIDDLLNFSRLGRKNLQKNEVDMNELVENVMIEMDNLKGLKTNFIKRGKLHNVKADRELLYQAIFNLVSNAVKYSSKKERPSVEIFSEEKNGEVIFCIKDNGVGFDMDYSDKLFGVFQRLHSQEEFEGTGVGLAIVHKVITKHGGRVWAEGKVNEGAVFSFSLPKN